ncbi:MAG: type II toxin-antitoxin system VapC family toxin [Parvularculaceae bacterium]
MIVVDTGPFIALFDPRDAMHEACRKTLKSIDAPLATTLPVLTEAFHILSPESRGSQALRRFIGEGGAAVCFLDEATLDRAFELMEKYADHPMDLADASVIAAAEALGTRKVFTLDLRDFGTYRIRRGHRHYAVEIV